MPAENLKFADKLRQKIFPASIRKQNQKAGFYRPKIYVPAARAGII